jgi:hypothetical protein
MCRDGKSSPHQTPACFVAIEKIDNIQTNNSPKSRYDLGLKKRGRVKRLLEKPDGEP